VNDDELQRAYARTIRSPSDRTGCPEPEAIADLAARRGTEEARLATLDHVMTCAACRRDLDLLIVADRAGARYARPRVWIATAAAAVLVLGVGALGARMLIRERSPDVERGGATALAVSPERGAAVTRPVALRWHAVTAGAEYRVELLAPDGNPLWSAVTSDSLALVPDSIVARGGDYGWWVTARRADGTTLRSPVTPFTVR
jgi:hypothetical protein